MWSVDLRSKSPPINFSQTELTKNLVTQPLAAIFTTRVCKAALPPCAPVSVSLVVLLLVSRRATRGPTLLRPRPAGGSEAVWKSSLPPWVGSLLQRLLRAADS